MDDTPARKVEPGMGNAPKESGGVSDDESNRDKVWEARRRANYKSVISGVFGSDFSWKIALGLGRLIYRNTIYLRLSE
ncbi:hypothetical protein [Bradyrhizobium sp. LB11.1]|uniref:hypothetical protein n=1 Tax=Bradyrhizobium sp. LB11.1 TaxID=3156326 RepID=UPI003390C8A7